ncbi:MAG: hypothetical protein JWP97_4060 [Labilithrix sp.]|nr:hypothetical protein [Labilithrix sp.]
MNHANSHGQQKKSAGRGVIALIAFGCLFGGCAAICAVGAVVASKTAAAASETGPAAPSSAAAEPRVYEKVAAAQLVADYEGNEVRGDKAWKGHDVEVTGIVKSIDKGPLGGLYVVIGSGEPQSFHSVQVNLKDSETARAATLTKGETATLKGRVLGYTIGAVSMREGIID